MEILSGDEGLSEDDEQEVEEVMGPLLLPTCLSGDLQEDEDELISPSSPFPPPLLAVLVRALRTGAEGGEGTGTDEDATDLV